MARRTEGRRKQKQSPDVEELMLLELREIHSAENQLTKALPRLSKAVAADKLRQMIDRRLDEGGRLIQEIESVFDEMEESPGRKRNTAAEGLISDLREHAQELERGPALDAVLLGGLQKTEHYCIAAWGTARALGESLDQESVTASMQRALEEGKAFDAELTELAEQELLPALSEQNESDDDEEEDDAEDEDESSASLGKKRRGGR